MPSWSSTPGPGRPGSPPSDGGFGPVAMLAFGLCCGLPLLVSAGALTAAGGLAGSPVAIAAGLVLALAGLASWRARGTRGCRYDAPSRGRDAGHPAPRR